MLTRQSGTEWAIRLQGLGDRLRAERERLGLSQAELAELVGVTRNTVYRYEADEFSPSLAVLEAAQRGGMDVGFVITGLRMFSEASTANQPMPAD